MVAVHGEPFIICQLNISCYSPHIYLPLSSSSLLRDNTAKQWRVNTVRQHTTCLQTVFVLFFCNKSWAVFNVFQMVPGQCESADEKKTCIFS